MPSPFEPQDPDYAARVRASYERQTVMRTLGARLLSVEPGAVSIELPYRPDFTQQHGFIHAGIVSVIVDSACGYAAFTLMPPNAGVLTAEFKINLVAPAKGERIIAYGRVKKGGATLTVCQGDAFAVSGREEKLVATMQATVVAVYDREDVYR